MEDASIIATVSILWRAVRLEIDSMVSIFLHKI